MTFNGRKIRGNVSTLQIVDIGNNGCTDASNEVGGSFSQNFGVIRVSTSETSSIHLYRMQTTKRLPYDASEMDVKAAIESLTRSCRVEVSNKQQTMEIFGTSHSLRSSQICVLQHLSFGGSFRMAKNWKLPLAQKSQSLLYK